MHVAALARSVSGAVDVETVLSRMTDVGAASRPGSACVLHVVDAHTGAWRVGAWSGRKPADPGARAALTERVVRDRASALVAETTWDGDRVATYGVPLTAGGAVLGVLELTVPAGLPFDEDERAVVEALAGHAAVALRTAQLLGEREGGRRTAEALAEIGRALAQSLDPNVVAQRIADLVRAQLDAHASVLYRLVPESGDLVVLAASQERAPGLAPGIVIPARTGIAGLAAHTRATVVSADIFADPRFDVSAPVRRIAEQGGYRAALGVPLMLRGEVVGVLGVGLQGDGVCPDDVARVELFAGQAALALENARAYEAAARGRSQAESGERRSAFIAEASRILASSLDYESTLATVARLAVRSLGDGCVVDVLDEDGVLRRVAVAGLDPAREALAREVFVRYPPDPDGPHPVMRALRTGEPQVVNDITETTLTGLTRGAEHLRLARSLGLRAALVAPLLARGRTLGAMSFVWTYSDRRYGESDLTMACELAHRAALAIDNAGLFRESEARRREAEVLADRLARLQSVTDSAFAHLSMDDLLGTLLERIVGMLGADTAAIFLVDGAREHLVMRAGAGIESGRRRDPLPLRSAGSGLVASEGRPLRIDDLAGMQLATDYLHAIGMRSLLAVPLRVEGRVLGVVRVAATRARAFDDADVTLLQRVGDRAALAIEQSRLWEAERGARASAETANRMKDEFLATISHELRTPLTAILGWAEVLRRGGAESPAQTSRAIDAIHRNARVQVQLVDDLLDVSRIITGKLRLDLRPVTLEPIVEGALEAVAPAATAKGVHLEPFAPAQATVLLGDPDRLQQVLWNLLSNAVKFTPSGGRVRVAVDAVGTSVRVRVMDTGKGIGPDFLPHVFERFRQASAGTTRHHGGIGLGLAIVRHLVELHGGTVAVESDGEGQGSTFAVELPLDRSAATPTAAGEAAVDDARDPSAHVLAGVRVLLVDDEPDARELLAVVLERFGASVTVVASARDALAALDRALPDVIVSDIAMPDEDGRALLRAVRARPAASGGRVPALALSAYARGEDRAEALAAGFEEHLSKPVKIEVLVRALAALVDR